MNEKNARVLFWIWFAILMAGTVAELLGLSWLTSVTDVKRFFLA